MKRLTNFERKHLLLGLLLMCSSIIFYVICTWDVKSTDVFKIFFPVFWGVYSVVLVSYILLSGWLMCRTTDDNLEDSDEIIEKEVLKHKFLFMINILTTITMVAGYISSTFKDVSVQYSTYQPLVWTLAICIEIVMYVIYLFKEDIPNKSVSDSNENKVQGTQLISFEDALRILEENGYELEKMPEYKEESASDSDKDTTEGNETTLPATVTPQRARLKKQKEYKKREESNL